MSLLNDVLLDLQTRGAFGVDPLTGLEPVANRAVRKRWRMLMIPTLATLLVASAITLWPLMPDMQSIQRIANVMGEAETQPQSEIQILTETSPQTEPDAASNSDDSRSDIRINRTGKSGPAPRDDYSSDTTAAAPPIAAESAISAEPAVSPATVTVVRRETRDASTPAAVRVTRGLAAMRGNDLLTAERLFREALAVDSGDGAVWSYLYSVLLRASKPAAAEQALGRGLTSARQPAPLAKLYARMLLDRGEKDAAIGILQTHRPAAASDTEYDAFLAALLQQLGQHAEAGEIYRTLLTIDQTSGSWWIGLAMSRDSLGNRPDALSAFQRAMRADSLKTPLARYARRRIAELQAND